MQIRINNVRIGLTNNASIKEIVAKKIGIRSNLIHSCRVIRRAIDARRKNNICLVYHLVLDVPEGNKVAKKMLKEKKATLWIAKKQEPIVNGELELSGRPIVVGSGPAGFMTALELAKNGYKPILLERGKNIAQRVEDVNKFWKTGEFDPSSNVQFGAGGAGTFSDGKLTTRVNDSIMDSILKEFVDAGAEKDILIDQKPHVGTDRLRAVITRILSRIENLGGEVRYQSKVVDLIENNHKIEGVVLENGEELKSDVVVLACGHSARDTYEMLYKKGVEIEAKSFAIGVRVEHSQKLIDKAQYGEYAGNLKLGSADYVLVYHDKETSRSAYSFCMCPGGSVIVSSSEEGGIVTNGMSMSKRDSGNANAAIVVNINTSDFANDPLAGIEFQRKYEKLAYNIVGKKYKLPAQNMTSFLNNTEPSLDVDFTPSCINGLVCSKLEDILPKFVIETLKKGLVEFGKKIKGFDQSGLVLGVETRTSAPLRIKRDEHKESISHKGLYPAGEGAGYAGGIMSAAIDGYYVAHEIIKKFKPVK
jgi:uncharacterized FAD-dependent dehydrogenase